MEASSISNKLFEQLNFRGERQKVISSNIANINTPGYKTKELVFEDELNNSITNNSLQLKATNSKHMTNINSSLANSNPKLMEVDNLEEQNDGNNVNLDNFLVDSNGNNVLNAGNEPIVIEDGFELQIGVVKTPFTNLEKLGDNTYSLKDANNLEIFENNDTFVVQGAIEKSNVNSVSAMVELIDAHRRFDQSQKAVKSIDDLNAALIDKIGSNTK